MGSPLPVAAAQVLAAILVFRFVFGITSTELMLIFWSFI